MVIRSVSLTHVRNHEHTEISCARDVNVLTGQNGSGKTSILEAISLCAIAKSFVPVSDQALIQHGHDDCTSTVDAVRDLDVPYRVTVSVRNGTRKRITTAHGSSLTPRDIIGELPMVALSPDHKSVTFGGPAERRAFLDGVMAQSSRRFTELLYEHRRLLKQRNAALQHGALSGGNEVLDVWTEQFVNVSAEIVERRHQFLVDVTPIVCSAYEAVSGAAEEISVVYQPDVVTHGTMEPGAPFTAIAVTAAYTAASKQLRPREMARETTMFGPQKDEIAFMINGGLVRETASQGQHKSLLVALKLAECILLHERCNERPIVLLDDVFSELDRDRCARVLDKVLLMGMQCFVTTTDGENVMRLMEEIDAARGGGIEMSMISLEKGHAASTPRTGHTSITTAEAA
ncbi:MAG TPA: DNA replication and repair protein RecF [Candidatus Didemnitutus sp.]|nr:DNA replication and repair protein RecF [Candidatus Didemnitutus sp.]